MIPHSPPSSSATAASSSCPSSPPVVACSSFPGPRRAQGDHRHRLRRAELCPDGRTGNAVSLVAPRASVGTRGKRLLAVRLAVSTLVLARSGTRRREPPMDASGAVRWIVGFALLTAVGCGESSSPPTSPIPRPSRSNASRASRAPRYRRNCSSERRTTPPRAARSVIRGQVQRVNLEFGRAAQAIQSLSAKPYQEIASGEFLFEQSGVQRLVVFPVSVWRRRPVLSSGPGTTKACVERAC